MRTYKMYESKADGYVVTYIENNEEFLIGQFENEEDAKNCLATVLAKDEPVISGTTVRWECDDAEIDYSELNKLKSWVNVQKYTCIAVKEVVSISTGFVAGLVTMGLVGGVVKTLDRTGIVFGLARRFTSIGGFCLGAYVGDKTTKAVREDMEKYFPWLNSYKEAEENIKTIEEQLENKRTLVVENKEIDTTVVESVTVE